MPAWLDRIVPTLGVEVVVPTEPREPGADGTGPAPDSVLVTATPAKIPATVDAS
jgi:hypothetical protein